MQSLEYLSSRHRAYLLYCWADSASDVPHSPSWRFAITRVPYRGQRQGLASLADLVAFLNNELSNAEGITADCLESESDDGEDPDSLVSHNSADKVVEIHDGLR